MRKVLITGASKGLGYQLAESLSPTYQIILTARELEKAEQAKQQIISKVPNANIIPQKLDISRFDSVKAFYDWIKQTNTTIDVLVNNAAINDDYKTDKLAFNVMSSNLFGLINITEVLLPYLTSDAKVILLAGILGKVKMQPKTIQEQLNKPLTKQEILKMASDLVEIHDKTGKYGDWASQQKPLYSASKALVNAYGRYVLSNSLKPNQSVYCVSPGWVKTDMGGKGAPLTIQEGVKTQLYLINQIPFGRDPNFHGKHFNEKQKIEDF